MVNLIRGDISMQKLKDLRSVLDTISPVSPQQERELFMRNEFQTGSAYTQQLMDTNTNLNEMMSHSKRQNELKALGQLFEDVNLKVDDYRDGIQRKLNELHMSLQRPKVPISSPMPGISFGERLLMEEPTKTDII